ncbi:MAG: cell division protein ZapE [Gammaproteobacteria bacterium]|nr:cell division protein ZapE [Gammaproteobacteria bacterium]
MTPREHHRHALEQRGYSSDPCQVAAVELLDRLHRELVDAGARQMTLLPRLLRAIRGRRSRAPRGIYLWGGVGRGKTWLMDLFFDGLPFGKKLRMHFHRFMRHVHQELAEVKEQSDPLRIVADRFAAHSIVLCFDEFHVSDITDAMLLGRLLELLFARGVTLVATSNIAPHELYRDGLQRERFLPAIDLLNRHTQVFFMDGAVDYRMRYLDQAQVYFCPAADGTDAALDAHFDHLAPESGSRNMTVEIEGRRIPVARRADSVAWFEFAALCEGPRSVVDYIEIARQFQTVLISRIPQLGAADNDAALRLINLVDELYDRNVRLLVSAAAPAESLYTGGRHAAAFRRTASRLAEMQSKTYLARPHRPG